MQCALHASGPSRLTLPAWGDQPIASYTTGYETGYEGPDWRLPCPSPASLVEERGVWCRGYLRKWKRWPDGWYGLIRWGDHHDAQWVPEDRLQPALLADRGGDELGRVTL